MTGTRLSKLVFLISLVVIIVACSQLYQLGELW